MATTASQDKLRKPLAFTTTEHGGNEVICTQKTWNRHIAVDHPAMAGLKHEVEIALADPAVIYPSTLSNNALVYEATTSGGMDFRVVVTFDDLAAYGTGSTKGKLNSAFPVDVVIYDTPHIGAPIYTRGTPVTSKKVGGGS
jgi:hypothetical protein